MDEQKIEKMLTQLANSAAEPASQTLAEEIKKQIPASLKPHRGGMDSFNIVIDLRVSKLAAAAAIILTMALWANLLERGDSAGGGLYDDCKMLLKYHFNPESNELALVKSRYQYLVEQGKEVTHYGRNTEPKNENAVLLQWKLSDGNYRVVFAGMREETVTAEKLIKLQAKMLQKNK